MATTLTSQLLAKLIQGLLKKTVIARLLERQESQNISKLALIITQLEEIDPKIEEEFGQIKKFIELAKNPSSSIKDAYKKHENALHLFEQHILQEIQKISQTIQLATTIKQNETTSIQVDISQIKKILDEIINVFALKLKQIKIEQPELIIEPFEAIQTKLQELITTTTTILDTQGELLITKTEKQNLPQTLRTLSIAKRQFIGIKKITLREITKLQKKLDYKGLKHTDLINTFTKLLNTFLKVEEIITQRLELAASTLRKLVLVEADQISLLNKHINELTQIIKLETEPKIIAELNNILEACYNKIKELKLEQEEAQAFNLQIITSLREVGAWLTQTVKPQTANLEKILTHPYFRWFTVKTAKAQVMITILMAPAVTSTNTLNEPNANNLNLSGSLEYVTDALQSEGLNAQVVLNHNHSTLRTVNQTITRQSHFSFSPNFEASNPLDTLNVNEIIEQVKTQAIHQILSDFEYALPSFNLTNEQLFNLVKNNSEISAVIGEGSEIIGYACPINSLFSRQRNKELALQRAIIARNGLAQIPGSSNISVRGEENLQGKAVENMISILNTTIKERPDMIIDYANLPQNLHMYRFLEDNNINNPNKLFQIQDLNKDKDYLLAQIVLSFIKEMDYKQYQEIIKLLDELRTAQINLNIKIQIVTKGVILDQIIVTKDGELHLTSQNQNNNTNPAGNPLKPAHLNNLRTPQDIRFRDKSKNRLKGHPTTFGHQNIPTRSGKTNTKRMK